MVISCFQADENTFKYEIKSDQFEKIIDVIFEKGKCLMAYKYKGRNQICMTNILDLELKIDKFNFAHKVTGHFNFKMHHNCKTLVYTDRCEKLIIQKIGCSCSWRQRYLH